VTILAAGQFRFIATTHEYVDPHGVVLPHITGLLEQAGLVDDRWFTDESSVRGTAVHRLTADYDLGLMNVKSCVSVHKPYLLAHVKLMAILRPTWLHVEEPMMHPHYRFCGRTDRVAVLHGQRGVFEIKSGAPARAHQIQTALQAILDSAESGLPPDAEVRYCAYYNPNGKLKLVQHIDRRDFDEAQRIIARFC
jgi:hypothetical protein